MGDSTSEQRPGRRGRPRSPGSSVLTPPTGLPELPEATAGTRQPVVPATVVEPCACGHPRAAHEHYRRGTDCGACGAAGCEEFRPVGGPVRRVMRRWGLVG